MSSTLVPDVRFRIAVGGLACENNTFAPQRTVLEDFVVLRGSELRSRYEFMRDDDYAAEIVWLPLMFADADAGGAIDPETYDTLEDEFLDRLGEVGPIDGLVLDIHGAMAVAGRMNCEERLLERIRRVIGAAPLVSAAMDPHGNVSKDLVAQVDILTAHRLSPHEDASQTRERAAGDLVRCLRVGMRPVTAWTSIPVLLNGEMTSTVVEPGRSVFALINEVCGYDEIVDAGIWVGFAWADEPRCRAAATATGFSRVAVKKAAERLARAYWDAREDFDVVAPSSGTVAEAIEAAVATASRPMFVSDSGDNVTAGAAGDTPAMLAEILKSDALTLTGKRVLFAGMMDPESVADCAAAGVGSDVHLKVGGKLGHEYGAPVEVDARVCTVRDGYACRTLAGPRIRASSAVVEIGNVTLVLTARQMEFVSREDFEDLGFVPGDFDVVIVKNGYLYPYQQSVSEAWFMAITRGSTDLDPRRLEYARVDRPLFPLDRTMPTPNLEPRVFPPG